jgi:hypothetical protein
VDTEFEAYFIASFVRSDIFSVLLKMDKKLKILKYDSLGDNAKLVSKILEYIIFMTKYCYENKPKGIDINFTAAYFNQILNLIYFNILFPNHFRTCKDKFILNNTDLQDCLPLASLDKPLEYITELYYKLYNSKHQVRIALYYMDSVPACRNLLSIINDKEPKYETHHFSGLNFWDVEQIAKLETLSYYLHSNKALQHKIVDVPKEIVEQIVSIKNIPHSGNYIDTPRYYFEIILKNGDKYILNYNNFNKVM